ncbi:intersectin [Schistosoma bovis]|uniref:Intersectin n=1 Tax=Schistosoma bovis TaxID=6184 RepID=A0A430QH64_SCHBO|nr:intersectin [Schistosoma bovis]
MLQVISHHQSINQSNLNGRLIVHLDHSNILHLFSYWRPEISEDLSLSMNGLPKQINSIIQFSFSKIYQYGQQFIIMFTNNSMNSIDQIQFNQFINIIYSDLEYTTYLLIYWINNESIFIESINIPIIKNILSMNLNITKLNFLEKWHGYNKIFNNLIQSKFNLIKYFDNIYKHLMIYIESNIQHNSFQKLIDNINPFLNYLVNKTIEKSEDFSKDSIKGLTEWDRWVITTDDRVKHDAQFQFLKPVGGYITGDQARVFFMKSGLSVMVLGQIWALADMDMDGKMDKKEFSIAMFLIKKTLEGLPLPPTLPPGLKKDPQPAFITSGVTLSLSLVSDSGHNGLRSVSSNGQDSSPASTAYQDWIITSTNRPRYRLLFNQHDRNKRGFLTGVEARSILSQYGLPNPILAHIWNLADLDKNGNLNCDEFCIAIFLIEKAISGSQLPNTLPSGLLPSNQPLTIVMVLNYSLISIEKKYPFFHVLRLTSDLHILLYSLRYDIIQGLCVN